MTPARPGYVERGFFPQGRGSRDSFWHKLAHWQPYRTKGKPVSGCRWFLSRGLAAWQHPLVACTYGRQIGGHGVGAIGEAFHLTLSGWGRGQAGPCRLSRAAARSRGPVLQRAAAPLSPRQVWHDCGLVCDGAKWIILSPSGNGAGRAANETRFACLPGGPWQFHARANIQPASSKEEKDQRVHKQRPLECGQEGTQKGFAGETLRWHVRIAREGATGGWQRAERDFNGAFGGSTA